MEYTLVNDRAKSRKRSRQDVVEYWVEAESLWRELLPLLEDLPEALENLLPPLREAGFDDEEFIKLTLCLRALASDFGKLERVSLRAFAFVGLL